MFNKELDQIRTEYPCAMLAACFGCLISSIFIVRNIHRDIILNLNYMSMVTLTTFSEKS